MAVASWLSTIDALSPAALTVRAQELPPTDQGNLLWDMFLPRENVDSVDLADISTLDYRPTADRREWNARGRRIPLAVPPRRLVSIVPIEANDKIDEKEMQRIAESAGGNAQVIRDIIGASIPQRVDRLVDADFRRLEYDAMRAWALGSITQRNPENAAQTYTASFGFAAARYTTAGTAWNDVGVNAYDLLQAWITAAEDLVGPIEGVMLRLATLNAILADAPNLENSVKMTRTSLEERVQQDKGGPFEFFLNENSIDIFDDGGTAYTRTKVWPTQTIAAIPVGKKVGRTCFAPVVRAMDLVSQVGPAAGIDVRGVTVFYEESNGGRELSIEAQLNALPVPDEGKLYVSNVGV
jgi:hypothetical protein